jgi:hypothetical protein
VCERSCPLNSSPVIPHQVVISARLPADINFRLLSPPSVPVTRHKFVGFSAFTLAQCGYTCFMFPRSVPEYQFAVPRPRRGW